MILTINAWKPISLENACEFHIPPLKAAYQRTSVGPAIQRSSVPAQFSVPAPRRPFSVAAYQRQAGKAAYQRTSVPAPGGESSVPAYQRRRLADPLSHRTGFFSVRKSFFQVGGLKQPPPTLPKLNSSPLKSYLPNRKGSSSNQHFSRASR